jgi:putative ABC transport system permease protein
VVVGRGAASEFAGLELGRQIKVGKALWEVVGHFAAGGGPGESEIWSDAYVLQSAYHRGNSFQVVRLKLETPMSFETFRAALAKDPRLSVKVQRETEYYLEQSTVIYRLVSTLGWIITVLMAFGAVFGTLNTMYSAVAARTREIATLRALGFGSAPILFSVVIEALVLALVGGAAGSAVAYLAFDGFRAATMNFQSFSQVAFAFDVSPALLLKAMACATVIGLMGGLFPAIRATRMPLAKALRET